MLRSNIRQLNTIVFQKMFNNYSAATSVVVSIIASLALLGWQFDISLLKHPIPQLVSMNPMSAVALLLSGISLLLHTRTAENKTWILTGKVLAAVVGTIGVLKIAATFSGLDTGIDRWLYEEKIGGGLLENMPNSIAPNTALNLIFI